MPRTKSESVKLSALLAKVERSTNEAIHAQARYYRAAQGTMREQQAERAYDRHRDATREAMKELREYLLGDTTK